MVIWCTYFKDMSEFAIVYYGRSYISDSIRIVQIDGIMSDLNIVTWLSVGDNYIVFVFASTWCDP